MILLCITLELDIQLYFFINKIDTFINLLKFFYFFRVSTLKKCLEIKEKNNNLSCI